MRGTAVHGDKYFDVPFISQIEGNLYQGGCTNGLILPHFIKHVISLYPWESYSRRHDLDTNHAVRMYDSLEGPDRDEIIYLAELVNLCVEDAPTLVHCQAGLNRSGLVAAVALMLQGRTAEEAITLLRTTRSEAVLCNPVFEQWVRDFTP
jgi:protein-tyrosine phosphatase